MRISPASARRISAALSLAALVALSACASNSDRRGPPDRDGRQGGGRPQASGTFIQPVAILFTSMDTNRDKRVSYDEMQVGAQAEWSGFGDRKPSGTTFAKWSVENLGSTDAAPTFMNFDSDFNGVVTQQEFTTELERDFKRLDKNGDNMLDRSEMIIAYAAQQGERSRGGQQGGGRGQGGGGGGRPPR